MGRSRSQKALVAEAATYLEELDEGDVDDVSEALQSIDEYLEAIDAEHAAIREALEAARAELLGERRPPKVKPARTSRKVKPGTKYKTEADRVGGERPFELTFAHDGNLRRISSLRVHMRFFFRVPKRDLLDELGAIYNELLAASEPFTWLQKTASQLYSAATASSLERARDRFACPAGSSCNIGLKSAELADDVAERRLDIAIHPRGSSAYTHCPSELHLTFPPTAMGDAFRDRFVRLCARLPSFLCGTAGYLLDAAFVRPAAAKQIMDAAIMHPGVELPGVAAPSVAANWISGVNWLTAIGAGARKVLGDDPRDPSIERHRAGDAIVLQAGPRPELGADRVAPITYQRVHAHIDRPTMLIGLPTSVADPRVNHWHRRHARV